MDDIKEYKREFTYSKRAWYDRCSNDDVIYFGLYHPDGGTYGEMVMRWEDLAGEYTPQLQVFNDGWEALATFTDLIIELGKHDDENITPDKFIKILKGCGFTDDTPYIKPKEGN